MNGSSLGNKQVLANNLKRLMDKKGVDRMKLSSDLGIKYTTLTEWLKANTYPRIDKIEMLAQYFNVEKSTLIETPEVAEKMQISGKMLSVFNKLEFNRQTNVLDYAKIQLKEQQNTISDNVVDIQEYLYPVTTINVAKGGKGYFYGDNDNNIRYTNKLLNPYDFALDVVGDSMADKINDGDVVCVRKDYDFTNGAIYVVDVDGESLIKKVYDSFDSLMLRSINKEYDDIVVQKSENVRIIGAVVDCFTPVK